MSEGKGKFVNGMKRKENYSLFDEWNGAGAEAWRAKQQTILSISSSGKEEMENCVVLCAAAAVSAPPGPNPTLREESRNELLLKNNLIFNLMKGNSMKNKLWFG